MSLFTVPEDLATALNRVFYAAGATAGVASGLLDVTARLFLSGLRAAKNENSYAVQADTPSEPQGLRQRHRRYLLPWLMFIPLPRGSKCSLGTEPGQVLSTSPTAPCTPKADDTVPHAPVDISGDPSEEGSCRQSAVLPPAAETWTLTEAVVLPSLFEENTNTRNVVRDDSSITDPAHSSITQCVEASAEAGESVAVLNDTLVDALMSAEDVIVDTKDTAPADIAMTHLTHRSLVSTELPTVPCTSGPTFRGEITEGMQSVGDAFETDCLNVECAHPLREATRGPASESVLHEAKSQSPGGVNPGQHSSHEARSERGESSSTASSSYGTAYYMDMMTGVQKSSRSRTPSETASTSATPSAVTPGLSYAQRLEEKRQSKRRKGAHKAQAR